MKKPKYKKAFIRLYVLLMKIHIVRYHPGGRARASLFLAMIMLAMIAQCNTTDSTPAAHMFSPSEDGAACWKANDDHDLVSFSLTA